MKTDLDTLKRMGQKAKDPILALFLYRKISIRITRILLPTRVTPNQITIFSFLLALVASYLFFRGGYLFVLGGAIILQLHAILDCVDGEVAKIKGLQSPEGALIDGILDRVADIAVFIALAFGIFNSSGSFWIWPIAMLGLSGTLTSSLVDFKLDALEIPKSSSLGLDKILSRFKFDIGWGGGANEFAILVGAIFNQMVPVLIAIALLSNAQWIARLLLNLRRVRM